MDEPKIYSREYDFIMLVRRMIIFSFIMLGTLFIRFNLLDVSFPFLFLLFFWFLTTIPFDYIFKKLKTKKAIENANFYYFILELFFLTIAIHYIGGIAWYGGIFYCITLIFAHFMLPRKRAIELTIIANFIFFNGLVALEFLGVIPHKLVFGPDLYNNAIYVLTTMFLTNFFIMFLAGILGIFANVLKKRKKEVEEASREVEQAKMILQVRVRARTKEAEESMKGLQNKVEEKTSDLNSKIKELEKLAKLTMGREERAIGLERKAEKLRVLLGVKK